MAERRFQHLQGLANSIQRDSIASFSQHTANVFQILRPARENLGHDEVFGTDDRDGSSPDRDSDSALEESVFQAGACQNEIDVQPS